MTATDSANTSSLLDVSAIALEADALRRVPRSLALRHDILSLSCDNNQLTIAIPDESDRDAIDRVRLATGMHVRAVAASRAAIRERLMLAYGGTEHAVTMLETRRADEAPAIRELDEIFRSAIQARASDVHIDPVPGGGAVRCRVDGMLGELTRLTPELTAQIVSRVKLLAGMDIADRRQPQDGAYSIEASGRAVDARVSSIPTVLGEKIAIRLLDRSARTERLDALGIPCSSLGPVTRVVRAPYGLFVVCGPTGSGKTTTAYAALAERDGARENLCSVEDPVEAPVSGVAQVQINPRAGVTFASASRAFLRQDPDVIMVGEMRDAETAAVAASAALTGQLVITTLHSNDAPRAVERLLELGVARYTLAAGLSGILAQRLVRRLCVECRERYAVPEQSARRFGIPAGIAAFRPGGCSRCAATGYAGRAAIFEFIAIGGVLRAGIAGGESSFMLAQAAKEFGYQPMIAHGIARVLAGETSLEELERVLPVGDIE